MEVPSITRRLLVGQHLGIGQAGRVVNADVHALADDLAAIDVLGVEP